MSILILLLVLIPLIVVHEFGHFIVAKLSGMRVDEFGLGLPPKALTIAKKGETEYTLNWLPFGGFVKIYGENGGETGSRSFTSRPRILQALVLVAGIAMNLLFAYVLITSALVMGTPRALSDTELPTAKNLELIIGNVFPSTPAAKAGLLPGDTVVSAADSKGQWKATDPKSFSSFIAASGGEPVTLQIKRNGKEESITGTAVTGIVTSDPSRYALGVEIATVGVVPLSLGSALVEGAQLTWGAITLTAQGLWHFFYNIFIFKADLSQVAGPIGIAGVVGSASMQGLGYLFSIMAIISINLALINLIPVPALDGGRLLFVIIEGIIRKPIQPRIAATINAIGFVFLIVLMVVVTGHDIFKLIAS